MAEKFSWDRLLKRNKKSDAPTKAETGGVAPLHDTQSIAGTETDANGRPVFVAWDSYRAIPDHVPSTFADGVSAPPVEVPPVAPSAFPPELSHDSAIEWLGVDEVSAEAASSPAPAPTVPALGPVAPGAWGDVELTPREMASANGLTASESPASPVASSFGEVSAPPVGPVGGYEAPAAPDVPTVYEGSPVYEAPAYEAPPVYEVTEEVASLDEILGEMPDLGPVEEPFRFDVSTEEPVTVPTFEPVEAEVSSFEPPVSAEPVDDGIPDIFKRAMALQQAEAEAALPADGVSAADGFAGEVDRLVEDFSAGSETSAFGAASYETPGLSGYEPPTVEGFGSASAAQESFAVEPPVYEPPIYGAPVNESSVYGSSVTDSEPVSAEAVFAEAVEAPVYEERDPSWYTAPKDDAVSAFDEIPVVIPAPFSYDSPVAEGDSSGSEAVSLENEAAPVWASAGGPVVSYDDEIDPAFDVEPVFGGASRAEEAVSTFDAGVVAEPSMVEPSVVEASMVEAEDGEVETVIEFQDPLPEPVYQMVEALGEPTDEAMPTAEDLDPVTASVAAEPSVADASDLPVAYLTSGYDFDTQKAKDRRLGELLTESKLITQRQLERALKRQEETHEKLGAILVAMQTISERRLLQVLAAQKGVNPWYLEEDLPCEEALKLVPEDLCRVYQVLPVAVRDDILVVAMRDVRDQEAITNLSYHTKMTIEPVMADEARLAYTIDTAFEQNEERQVHVTDELVDEAMAAWEEYAHHHPTLPSVMSEADTAIVAELVNHIIEEAVRHKASDIHIEPRAESAEVRYRLDGQLMKMRDIPSELVPMVVARIQLMAGLDQSDTTTPQDGKSAFLFGNNNVGLRVSSLPNMHGSRLVMRVLDKTVSLRPLDGLGFEETNLEMFRELIAKPYGLVLVTGPTGSGKTTSLYAALDELKESATNIMTCEDPVEYEISGISQAEINERKGVKFSDQLKAILRQDPDVVLVGEIRDRETAETAVHAATSGQMVLSTLHCNDAASAIPRLLDMGIDPFTLSTALVGVVNQRLIRLLCPHCKEAGEPTADEAAVLSKQFGLDGVSQVWHAKGCARCMGTGYKGRTAVSEVMPVSSEISNLIASRGSLEDIRRTAAFYGYLPMQQDAMARVIAGETTVEEAQRVLAFETIEKRREPRRIALKKAS